MRRQTGFGAIAAILILVILAALAAALMRIGTGQQLGSVQDLLSARAWQAAKAGNEWGLYQALHRLIVAPNASGAGGATTITTTNDFLLLGVVEGRAVSGTGVAAGATVASVDSNTQITVSVANSGTVSGPLTFGGGQPDGIWQPACAVSPQTLDLHVETGFWVTVTCVMLPYTEGTTTANPVRVYRITSVACNSSAGCPNNAMATAPNYIERMREVIATDR